MIKNYEGTFILDPALKEEDAQKRVQEISNSITSRKGELLKQEHLGKKILAYPILKHKEGDYYILNFKAPSEIISSIKSEYKLMQSIIRYMIITI